MKGILKIFGYLKKYKMLVLLHVIFTILTVFFSTFSFVLSEPFFKILFERTNLEVAPQAFAFNIDAMVGFFKYQLYIYVQQHGQAQALAMLCLFVVIVFFLKNLSRYLSAFVLIPVSFGVVRDLRKRLNDKILELQISFFSDERRGDLIGRMTTDVVEVQTSVFSSFEALIREPLMIVSSLAVMLYISPRLTLIAFLLMIFVGGVIGGVGRRLKKRSHQAQTKLGELMSLIDETITGLKIIKGFNAIDYQTNKFDKANNAYRQMMIRMEWRTNAATPLSEFLGVSVVVALLWYGGSLVFEGNFAMETFLLFIVMFYNMTTPAKNMTKAWYNIQKGLGAAQRIDKILGATPTIRQVANPVRLPSLEKSIDFQNVVFEYDKDRTILRNVNLFLGKGTVTALVGESGAGKSTLADLIVRFYDVTGGAILIDGTNIKDIHLGDLRSLMGIVTQHPILFHDTIYNNIVFGIEGVKKEAVIAAAKIAHAHDFIMETEKGYDTMIGDQGQKLSGGQRQRLTIARAILKNPPILILDEATSALDSSSEKLVQDALATLMQNRTAIVIAHRLSTIQHADQIVVMKEGEIEEIGTHESLIQKEGIYKKLVELQKL